MAEKKKAEKEQAAGSGAKKSKKLLAVVSGVVLLSGGGAWLALFSPWQVADGRSMLGMNKAAEEQEKPRTETQNFLYKMDPFIVNLADAERMRYLKIKLEVESAEDKANEEYEKRLPQLRDDVFTVLTGKTSKEIMDSEGKARLRNEIAARLNERLATFRVKTVYFSEFVIQ